MVKREVGIVAHLPLGVVVLEMITAGGVLHLGAESPSCLFSPPSESALASQLALSASCDQRAPFSLAGVVSHDPGWPVVRLHRPLVPEHAVFSQPSLQP